MTKFNVGDKVIFNKENAHVAKQFDYKINKPYEVQEVFPFHCTIQIINEKGTSHSFDEERFELVESKPTKNQRITALENEVAELRPLKQEVAELKLIVHELRDGPKTMRDVMNEVLSEPSTTNTVEDIIEFEGQQYRKVDREAREGDIVTPTKGYSAFLNQGKMYRVVGEGRVIDNYGHAIPLYTGWEGRTHETVAVYELIKPKPLTQNQQRAEIIEKAKAFVDENGGDDYHFEVDENERTVFAWKLVRNGQGYKAQHGIATCNPSDVYNEYLGRAISFGRAECLDVSEFEQAVQPTEFVVGQKVFYKSEHGESFSGIRTISGFNSANLPLSEERGGYMDERKLTILNDTNAKYEVSNNE